MDSKDEQIQLATAATDNQEIIPVDNDEILVKEDKVNKCSATLIKLVVMSIVIIIVCIILIAVLIWHFKTSPRDSQTVEIYIDPAEWCYDALLSEEIDESGLQHGIVYKQFNLSYTENGIYRIDFDEFYAYNGPIGYSQMWLNAQSRVVYNYALSYQNIEDERFLKYAVNGANALFNYFYDDIYGGCFRSIILYDNGTQVIDNPIKDVYQHLFVVKALSKLYQVTLNDTYITESTQLYNMIWANFTDSTGVGLHSALTRNFQNVTNTGKHTNDMLHFFHASLHLYEAYEIYYDKNGVNITANNDMLTILEDKINKIYDFIMNIRLDQTVMNEKGIKMTYSVFCEHYVMGNNNKWIPDPSMLVIDNIVVGHSFELAAFIWKCIDLGIIEKSNDNILKTNELFEYSVALSYNDETGSLDYKYFNTTLDWYWWHHTQWWMGIEAIRTIVYYNYNYDNSWSSISNTFPDQKYITKLQRNVLQWYNDSFYDTKYGGMYGQPSTADYSKGHQWKVGFHTIDACWDILNILQYPIKV